MVYKVVAFVIMVKLVIQLHVFINQIAEEFHHIKHNYLVYGNKKHIVQNYRQIGNHYLVLHVKIIINNVVIYVYHLLKVVHCLVY